MWETPYTGILTSQSWIISCLKSSALWNYKVPLLLIIQEDIQSMEQELSSGKVKPDRPT